MPSDRWNEHTSSGRLQGHIQKTESYVETGVINLKLDRDTAYALCNVLTQDKIEIHPYLEHNQRTPLISLGKALAVFVDHSNSQKKEQDDE